MLSLFLNSINIETATDRFENSQLYHNDGHF